MKGINQTLLESSLDAMLTDLPSDFTRAKAFVVFAVKTLLDLDTSDALRAYTDGDNDWKMDAIYLDEQDASIQVHIFQSKYKENLTKPISTNEMEQSINSVEDLVQGRFPHNLGTAVKAAIEDLIRSIDAERGKAVSYALHFVTNGIRPNDDVWRELKRKVRGDYLTLHYYDLTDLTNRLVAPGVRQERVVVETIGPVLPKQRGDIQGLVCVLPASEVVKIYVEGGEERVLNRNVRFYLGSNKVNKSMEAALRNTPRDFWYFNNGVSIVCDSMSYVPIPTQGDGRQRITLDNPSIVNGGQTTRTLVKAFKDDPPPQDAEVLARIYSTQDQELAFNITQGTNLQNPIQFRDLCANNRIQDRVKSYFSNKEVLLQTKRGENAPTSTWKVVQNDTVMQAYLAIYHEQPHTAKSSKTSAFVNFFDKVFEENNDRLPSQYFRAYELMRYVDERERISPRGNGFAYLPHANLALLYGMVLANPSLRNPDQPLQDSVLEAAYNMAAENIKVAISRQANVLGESYSHNRFFKGSESTVAVREIFKRD